MAYLSLSRQYRPQRFEDVYGQRHVTQTLQNALRMGRLGQAYLFCGPRGVGKTTVARILAKALNCAQGPTAEPCGQCDSCQRINSGSSLAVIEIDAASHRSIDDIRSLREDVQFAPTDGRSKVYILDEAHQITGPAFEAFLKTLEEPPAHAVFILATTEPQKIPATILSRCQRFDFRRVGLEDIVARLREVADSEKLQTEDAALYAIGRAADGGLRDALSVLDQVTAFGGDQVTAGDVEAVLGTLDEDSRFALGEALAAGDAGAALAWLGGLMDAGRDPRLLVDEALAHLRLLLLARLRCSEAELATLPAETRRRLADQAARFEPEPLMAMIESWAACDKALRWHPQPRILLEVTLLDVTALREVAPVRQEPAPEPRREPERAEPPRRPELRREPEPRELRRAAPEPRPVTPEPRRTEPLGDAEELVPAAVAARLEEFRRIVRENWPPLQAHVVHAQVERVEGSEVVLGLPGWEASVTVCNMPERRQVLGEALSRALGRPVTFRAELVADTSQPSEPDGAGPVDLDQAVVLAKETFPGSEEIDQQAAATASRGEMQSP